jgi:hypothetical protein
LTAVVRVEGRSGIAGAPDEVVDDKGPDMAEEGIIELPVDIATLEVAVDNR